MINKIVENLHRENLTPISGLDATFLYTETPTSPMNIGSVVIIDGAIDFLTFKDTVHSRIHQFEKLRQRLVYVPFSIDYPYWVDDPDFDIDLHIKHIALPKPGAWKQLRNTASQVFSEPLDQHRPLWSMSFVEGLDDIPQVPKGSIAIISKIHHVAVDGVGGAGLLSLFLDFTPDKKDIPEPRPYHPKPMPNEVELIVNSTLSFAKDPLKFPKMITNTLKATLKAGFLTRMQSSELPTAPFTAPATPLNGIISARRLWNSAILSLPRVQHLKNIMGTTLNDVLLAICSGALRRYLLEKEKLPEKSLVALVPISTRGADSTHTDNQISAMLVQIATNIEDPIERLETIHENNNRGKTYQGAIGAKTLSGMADAIPFGIANQAARLYSKFKISEFHKPVFNVAITNVPGPRMPLYINGHKMITVMGSAPIIDGMGLIITILSYDGHITISPVSDANSMPDLDNFTRYIWESANELEEAITEYQKKKKKPAPKRKTKPESEKLFVALDKFLKTLPDNGKPKSGVFQFNVKGLHLMEWIVDISVYPGKAYKGSAENPDATFTIEEEHLLKIAAGKLDVQTAFIQGRLKIDGDFDQAMRMGKLLGKMLA
ncbi:MAG: wax ester/triacylglycerol synthase family O-acyltransferase [Saprospiraceae bacterium]|nr:wax ester/triacylglycerol synthase family O-acyltransferase [Saprospiraceae bacterium]